MFESIAPILPARDLERALAFYAALGFDVRAYDGGGYGFATRDRVEIHLGYEGALVDPDGNVIRFGVPMPT